MKTLFCIILITINIYVFGDTTTIVSDIPASVAENKAKVDSLSTLQLLIKSVSNAQTIQGQIHALKNLSDFQQNPGAAIQQANYAVTQMINVFNKSSGTNSNNLSQLIGTLAGTGSSMGMNIKLMQSANMQLVGINNMLQQTQATQQALVTYKQAEIAQGQHGAQSVKNNNQATVNSIRNF